jgi:hypothetical protein
LTEYSKLCIIVVDRAKITKTTVELIKHTKKSAKTIARITDREIKKHSQEHEYLRSHIWYGIGDDITVYPGDYLTIVYEILASYNTGKFAIIQFINDEQNCIWQADNISDLNSVLYHQVGLEYYVTD